MTQSKPIIVITGSSGHMGSALTSALQNDFQIIGLDRDEDTCDIAFDITSDTSVNLALQLLKERYGSKIAVVIHLAAYFDFTGEPSPLYEAVNEQGTKRLLKALQSFTVERFIFASTMLVHEPCSPGETIHEETALAPKWAYPQSKARTEAVIKAHHGHIPYLILRLAGLYNDEICVPTLAHQIARTYERQLKSHLYAGDLKAGQAFIHESDLMVLFQKAIEQRTQLPKQSIILAGESETIGYETLQTIISDCIHEETLEIISIPPSVAKAGAWIESEAEPIIPNDLDQGEKPFIRPFMIDMASDHYALSIEKARKQLQWNPEHSIKQTLPKLIRALKRDPERWYEQNGLTPPDWMRPLKKESPDKIRVAYEKQFRHRHQQSLWAHFLNMGLGGWLLTSPYTLGYLSQALTLSDTISGILLICFAYVSLSWRFSSVRWCCAMVGLWLIAAPIIFWAPTAAAYLNDTLVGAFVVGFSVLVRPEVGVAPQAAMTGPTAPPGWNFSPSSWFQRFPIIILAWIGLLISRYMAAYQLGHIDSVWEPFFTGSVENPKNGTEEIITSYVSEAWPVPDAGLGAVVYLLEILTGVIGGPNRWRTMPWLVLLFGVMIVPLGVVSITFIIIQPVFLGTWCTLCLIGALAMLIQVPYSFDELVATGTFLWRRWRLGRPILRVLFQGDTEEVTQQAEHRPDSFEQSPGRIIRNMLNDGITWPWQLLLCIMIGVWLMFTRITLGASDGMANADHVMGALIITVSVIALAETVRILRFINIGFAFALCLTPFIYDAGFLACTMSILCGVLLFVLTLPRGKIVSPYGDWDKIII